MGAISNLGPMWVKFSTVSVGTKQKLHIKFQPNWSTIALFMPSRSQIGRSVYMGAISKHGPI